MSDENADVKLQLKVMVNRERNKVLYAVADNHFVDILLSFFTLPLGRIVRVLDKQFGDKAPKIGSLSSLYQSLADLDTSRFVTEGAKNTLLNPISSFEADYLSLKLDIADNHSDDHDRCIMALTEVCANFDSSPGAFTSLEACFTISDDLQIFSNETGLLQIITALGITDAHNAEEDQVEFGFNEFMKLLKASLVSQTPLSDVILPRKTRQVKYAIVEPQPEIEVKEKVNEEKLGLIVVIQESTGKVLYAQAKEDYIDFLFSLLHIPLGGVEHLLGGKTCFKAIDNLYRTTADLKLEYFKYPFFYV